MEKSTLTAADDALAERVLDLEIACKALDQEMYAYRQVIEWLLLRQGDGALAYLALQASELDHGRSDQKAAHKYLVLLEVLDGLRESLILSREQRNACPSPELK